MLNFTKSKTISIYLIFLIISFFAFLNFQKSENRIIDKKVNLGLDLQGGSYLLLEIDTIPLIQERIQDKVIPIKKLLKKNDLKYSNFRINQTKIFFILEKKEYKKLDNIFFF